MNKKVIWTIVIILVVMVGLFLIFGRDKEQENTGGGIVITDQPSDLNTQTADAESLGAVSLDTSDDVFTQLDSSLEYAS